MPHPPSTRLQYLLSDRAEPLTRFQPCLSSQGTRHLLLVLRHPLNVCLLRHLQNLHERLNYLPSPAPSLRQSQPPQSIYDRTIRPHRKRSSSRPTDLLIYTSKSAHPVASCFELPYLPRHLNVPPSSFSFKFTVILLHRQLSLYLYVASSDSQVETRNKHGLRWRLGY